MGKRKRGFLTDWQRDFMKGLIELKPSEKVSIDQRRRIELNEIRKSVFQALKDFRLVKEKGLIRSMEISRAIDVLTHFESWGRKKEGYHNIPLKCPKCGFQWKKHYVVVKGKLLSEGMTYGYL